MYHLNAQAHAKIIDDLINYAHRKLPTELKEQIEYFIRHYFTNVALNDLRSRSIADLYGVVCSHWNLFFNRKPHTCKIEVFNPNFEKHGWESTHTIIQIVTDDMPFLVDSLRMEINRRDFTIHLIIHPGEIRVKRDAKGDIQTLYQRKGQASQIDAVGEAIIYLELDRQTDPKVLHDLKTNIERIFYDVRVSVEDWHAMQGEMIQAINEIKQNAILAKQSDTEESIAFLQWAVEHFTFLGFRQYRLVGSGRQKALEIIPGSGLGVLRSEAGSRFSRPFVDLPTEARKLALSKQIMALTKTNTKASVHRPTYTDYIGIKLFDREGHIIGERRFIGLYTSEAYTSNALEIPLLRRKVEAILKMADVPSTSHATKVLLNILQTLPRDDLFHGNIDELYSWVIGIFQLQERRRIRLFMRKDTYSRYISCLVFVPRDNFNTDLLNKIRTILCESVNGKEVTFNTYFSESVLARIHFIIRIDPRAKTDYDVKEIENRLIEVSRYWLDRFRESLLDYFGEEKGNALMQRYQHAFPAGYRENFLARSAVYDVDHIESLSLTNHLTMSFYRPLGMSGAGIRIKLYHLQQTIPLSDALPILENMGLRVIGEQPYKINFADGSCAWINDFNMVHAQQERFNVDEIKDSFQETFQKVWAGLAEDDGFNRLVLKAKLNWREITLFRSYSKYFRQIGFTFSQEYIAETLSDNPEAAIALMQLFKLRFNPEMRPKQTEINQAEKNIVQLLDAVASLDQDRILRHFLHVIKATLRTNYFQKNAEGYPKDYLSFKFDPSQIPGLPLPLPMYELYVYSARFEGIHLRAAKVARGGIRWSDRREDFRTEVLGLMKAQQVKNAVIVPSGAKGGFVPKKLTVGLGREATLSEAIRCYKDFIRGMLDVTDNLDNQHVVVPKDTVCYDSDDFYLVVAADKGTATFSDIANEIAKEYQFWLGDAFASGGSTGYDHKKMGITARGAWESVKRHFQELGKNIQKTNFTVVGVGDMSGDVFGNGMLLSQHIQLVGAFDQHHIFLDPNPDPLKSYEERQRLFNLPRSSWEDYNLKLISAGGGVFSRQAKAIALSAEIKKRFNIRKSIIVPNELIQHVLCAPVDLLWNGGIGTYVKATSESNTDIGDRANDGLRVNAKNLRAKVVGEGGNLGFTQLARIEFAEKGGRINTDFIDNSAGVDCSDHEVNIKILLNAMVSQGDMTLKQRNQLLSQMAEEVALLVLHNNHRQVRALSLATGLSSIYINLYRRYIDQQEHAGKLDRGLEFLASDAALAERKVIARGFTRPEMAVLFAYSKIILKQDILNTHLTEEAFLSTYLATAFPNRLREHFKVAMNRHHLRREIIATQLSNAVVTDMGPAFIYQMVDESGDDIATVLRAYVIARAIFEVDHLWAEIDSLDFKISVDLQIEMISEVVRLLRRGTRWYLRNRRGQLDIKQIVADFAVLKQEVYANIPDLLVGAECEAFKAKQNHLLKHAVPESIATKIASLPAMYSILNVIDAAKRFSGQCPMQEVAQIHFDLAERLGLTWLREQVNQHPIDTRWTVLARAGLKADLDWQQRQFVTSVLTLRLQTTDVTSSIESWQKRYADTLARWQFMLADLHSQSTVTLDMLTVAVRELHDFAQACMADDENVKQVTHRPKKVRQASHKTVDKDTS